MSEEPAAHEAGVDRRATGGDRRARLWWSLAYGAIRPGRRDGRRSEDLHRPLVDWHAPELLASSIAVLVLCAVDAALTLRLLNFGAIEANPLMALLVNGDVGRFAITKIALTGTGVLLLVAVGRFRVFRVLRVSSLLHAVFAGYLGLVLYELSLLPLTG